MGPIKRKAALVIFGLLVTSAPLLFGAVDREIQIPLLLLLGVGLFLIPPSMEPLTPRGKWVLGLWLGLVVVKEFAPFGFFGKTKWHSILAADYSVAFPWTHNPEPGRAVDILLAITAAAIWFMWVRTLAGENENRPVMIWILFGSAAVLAIVSLSVHPSNPHFIYGVRLTQGWTGYGPFPNRNHTASFLAMGILLGCGCLTSAIRRGRQLPGVIGFLFLAITFVALLESKSRGGLIALAIGLAVYGALVIYKTPGRKALIGVLLGMLLFGALFAGFGMKVLSRFNAPGEGEIPTNIRWSIWGDTLSIWKDAPLFGHGLGTFAQIFPLYQTLKLENQIVLHPESSWLLWLVELGAVPLLVAVGAGGIFMVKNLRRAFQTRQGFFLRASGFAALAVLVFHSLWDVPAHRWAIAGYALAILATISPLSSQREKIVFKTRAALVPLGIAIFWMLPFFCSFPAWSPTHLTKLLSSDEALMTVPEIENELRWFPLSANLHQLLGVHLLSDYREPQAAWLHFRIADRLEPSLWPLAVAQAVASRPFSEGMTLYFWSLAIERAGHRGEEVFYLACVNTAKLPMGASFWSHYVENNPQLLLSFVQRFPAMDGRYYYQLWWKNRAFNNDLAEFEVRDFYEQLPKYGSLENLYEWMSRHPEWEKRDYKAWSSLLHYWKDDAGAWKLLSKWVTEPEYPKPGAGSDHGLLEAIWLRDPKNVINAQTLAADYKSAGDADNARRIILAVAAQDHAPVWFTRKAAYLQAGEGRYGDAVVSLLKD